MLSKFVVKSSLFIIHKSLKKIVDLTDNKLDNTIVKGFDDVRKLINRAL